MRKLNISFCQFNKILAKMKKVDSSICLAFVKSSKLKEIAQLQFSMYVQF